MYRVKWNLGELSGYSVWLHANAKVATVQSLHLRNDSMTDGWLKPNRILLKRFGPTNEQQLFFNELSISEFSGEVDSIQTSLKLPFSSRFNPTILRCDTVES